MSPAGSCSISQSGSPVRAPARGFWISDAEPVTIPLKAGAYTVALEEGWHVERTDAPGVPVNVVLASPNPLGFVVRADEDTPVQFLFKRTLAGFGTVTIGVDAGGWIAGTFTLDQWSDPSGDGTFYGLLGAPVAFTMSYEHSRAMQEGWGTTIDTGPVTLQFGGTASATMARARSTRLLLWSHGQRSAVAGTPDPACDPHNSASTRSMPTWPHA